MRNTQKLATHLFFLAFFASLLACKPIDTDNIEWKPQLLAPVLKSHVDIYDFEHLIYSNAEYEIVAANLQIPGYAPNVLIPNVNPINNISLPSKNLKISNFFNLVAIDSARINISLHNAFPISIGQNSKLTIRDSISNELISEHIFTQNIAPNQTYSFNLVAKNKIISNTLKLQMEEFYSPGGSNVIFQNNVTTINIAIEMLSINRAEIKNNVSYSDTSFSDVNFQINNDEAFDGTFSLFIDNNYPTDFHLALDLFDENNQFIYRFFEEPGLLINRALVDNQGNVIENVKLDLLDFIHTDQIPLLESAKKLRVIASFFTHDTPEKVIVTEASYIEIILTGKVAVSVNQIKP